MDLDLQSDIIWDSLVPKCAPEICTGFLSDVENVEFPDCMVGSDVGSSYLNKSAEFDLVNESNSIQLHHDEMHLSVDPCWLEARMDFSVDLENDDLPFDFSEFDEIPIIMKDNTVFESTLVSKEHSIPLKSEKESICVEPPSPEQLVPGTPSIISSPPLSPFSMPENDEAISVSIPSNDQECEKPDANCQLLLDSLMTPSNSDNDLLILSQNDQPVADNSLSLILLSQPTTSEISPPLKSESIIGKSSSKKSIQHKKKNKQVRYLEPSERKNRKMGQNKTAAARYREKKRIEFEQVHSIEQNLEKENTNLSSTVKQMESEIIYLKRLLREALVAKGLL